MSTDSNNEDFDLLVTDVRITKQPESNQTVSWFLKDTLNLYSLSKSQVEILLRKQRSLEGESMNSDSLFDPFSQKMICLSLLHLSDTRMTSGTLILMFFQRRYQLYAESENLWWFYFIHLINYKHFSSTRIDTLRNSIIYSIFNVVESLAFFHELEELSLL